MSEHADWDSGYRDLWQEFSRSDNQVEYCQGWLDLQCARIIDTRQGVLILKTQGQLQDNFIPIARWPAAEEEAPHLVELAERVIDEESGLVIELDNTLTDPSNHLYGVAYPLKIDQQVTGIVSIAITANRERDLVDAMENLQWGISWIELMIRRHQETVLRSDLPRLKSTVEILTAVLSEQSYTAACNTFVTQLSSATQSERVSFSMMIRGRLKVKAVSNSAQFGKNMNLIRLLEAAMEEAVFQRSDIIFPQPENDHLVTLDHTQLSKQHGCGSIYTLPLFDDDQYYAVLTLERSSETPYSQADTELIRAVAILCGSALHEKQLNDRLLISKIFSSAAIQFKHLFGNGYAGRKVALVILMAVIGYFSIATDTYRVTADTTLQGAVRQVVVAPFDGYIESSNVRAGDTVLQDQVLSQLDDRDLHLEYLNWISERSKLQSQQEDAIAKHDRGLTKVIAAQLEQNQAQINLVNNKLSRTRLLAPFNGLVINGDLSQRLGGAVHQGEVLFEVAPLNAYRLILWVDEYDIADIKQGQKGILVLKSLHNKQFDFSVLKVTPISEAREGGNYFRVESTIGNISTHLRPGMQGVSKIDIGERKQITILTRPLIRWLKLQFWAWFSA